MPKFNRFFIDFLLIIIIIIITITIYSFIAIYRLFVSIWVNYFII